MTDKTTIKALVVDDEIHVCHILSSMLKGDGYSCEIAIDGGSALQMLQEDGYHLLISDIMMPGISGVELLEAVQDRIPDLAVVMVTALDSRDVAVDTLRKGAYGYVVKPFDRNEILITVEHALERRRLALLSRQYEHELEEKVQQRTQDVRNREEEIVLRLMSAMGFRDNETGAHARRLGLIAAAVAEQLGWDKESRNHIQLAAPMHDVGKIGVPDQILMKPARLTAEEFETIKQHTVIGARILEHSEIPLLQLGSEIALRHHERWDGKGYPGGVSGTHIPESARIVALADVWDALVHDRVYRPALPEDEALEIMQSEREKQFDPHAFDAFKRVLPEVQSICRRVTDDEPDGGRSRLLRT